MTSTANLQPDLERGPDNEPERIAQPQSPEHEEQPESGRATKYPSGNGDPNRSQEEDFDENANDLWTLYWKEAKSRDVARFQALKDDMDGVLLFAGLFSGVLSAFVVPKIQDLQVSPAVQAVHYQQQAVQMLAQISQQIASFGTQIPINATLPSPPSLPTFHPSASDHRVNVFWLVSLVCSLSAALLATLVQQWVRTYMRVFQLSSNPLKITRIRQFLFEGVERLPMVAEAVPGLIHVSLMLFFFGLADNVLNVNTTVGITTIVPIVICVLLYLHIAINAIVNPQFPYRNPLSGLIWCLIQKLHTVLHPRGRVVGPASIEAGQEQLAMKRTPERMARDVRAVQGLVENINGSNEVESFILAIPGSFNREWGRDVWKEVVRETQSTTSTVVSAHHHPCPPPEGTAFYEVCRFVRNLFETYNNQGGSISKETRRRRIHGCVETAASLVCCTDAPLGWLGEVGEVLSELGSTEQINEPLTIRSNPSFTVRWTCLSLVAIRQMVMVESNRIRELSAFAVSGIARFQSDYGSPDAAALKGAQRIDYYVKTAWEDVEELHRAFEPWNLDRTDDEVRNILVDHELLISELEHIEIEADGMEDVDWRISLLQDAMDEATHKLTRRLPGVSFNELKTSGPIPITEAFAFPSFGTTPITPQLIFPGQQLQGLFTLGRGLRDIIEGRNNERHEEVLRSLESIDTIPVPLRRLKNLMTRQLWRLQDLHDGLGLGFTIELFFLALRQLSSASSSPEWKKVLYIGTFNVITSRWEESADCVGTRRILLDLICDLVIKSRGVFSGFHYPEYIVDELLKLVGMMVNRHQEYSHLVVQELRETSSRDCMDKDLRERALRTINLP